MRKPSSTTGTRCVPEVRGYWMIVGRSAVCTITVRAYCAQMCAQPHALVSSAGAHADCTAPARWLRPGAMHSFVEIVVTKSFWDTLPRPIIGLAPMNGVSDQPFRYMQKKYGNPMVLYTEFTAVERLRFGDPGLFKDFLYDESQRPIVAQVYGHQPELFRYMAILACELGFDAIDINMGCPSHSIVHRGAGAGLIRTPEIAQEIITETKAGVADWVNGRSLRDDVRVPRRFVTAVEARRAALPAAFQQRRALPVSVKTRIGYETPEVEAWIPRLLESEPAAIAIHGRTLRQAYAGSADWDEIGRAAQLARGSSTLILGNGDVDTLDDAHARAATYGLDGVLIGRGSYGNPFVFQDAGVAADAIPTAARSLLRMQIALEHAYLYEATFRHLSRYRFIPMRKHLNWYVRGVHSAAHIRQALMRTSSPAEAEAVLRPYLEAAEQFAAPSFRWPQPAAVID